jgi:hypothetical protein
MTLLQTIFALIIAALSAWGVTLAMLPTAEKPHYWKRSILMYTNQSNLLVCVYHLALAAALTLLPGWKGFLLHPVVQLSVTLCIMVTFLVFHFMLAKLIKLPPLRNRLVHYIVPLLTQAEWLLFSNKTGLGLSSALWWMVLPLVYVVFTCLRAAAGGNILYTNSPWPYPFIDMGKLGFGRWLRNILLMMVGFGLLGVVYVGIAKLICMI